MEKISKYFARHEVACKCGCGLDTIDAVTMRLADEVREYYGRPISPSSACRCEWWNGKEGGGQNSQHPKCRAIDLPVDNPKKVYDWLCAKYPNQYGFGLYDTFVHVDSRSEKARW